MKRVPNASGIYLYAPGFGLNHPEKAARKLADRWFSLQVVFSRCFAGKYHKKPSFYSFMGFFSASQTTCESLPSGLFSRAGRLKNAHDLLQNPGFEVRPDRMRFAKVDLAAKYGFEPLLEINKLE